MIDTNGLTAEILVTVTETKDAVEIDARVMATWYRDEIIDSYQRVLTDALDGFFDDPVTEAMR